MKIFYSCLRQSPKKNSEILFTKIWKIMRLLTFFLIIATLQISAKGYSQSVNLTASNITLKSAFRQIEKQTGYSFFANHAFLKKSNPVSLSLKDATITEALGACLKDQPFTYAIIDRTIILKAKKIPTYPPPLAPELFVRVQGRVTDSATGQPLTGVTIQVKGSTLGTVTDANGNFALDVADGAVLAVSYVGYNKKEIAFSGNPVIHISLAASTTGLNQLMVVGYGTQRKIDLTGAVDQVSGKRLQDRPITTVSEGLQGVFANLNVTTNSQGGNPAYGERKDINIRGYTGLGNAGAPLVLVDGVPADINTINPSDIATISILKDAASSAIYGSRAPYGVILIETKRGKLGEPLTLSYDANFSFSQAIHVPQEVNSLEYAKLYNEAADNAGRAHFYTDDVIEKIKKHLADPEGFPGTGPDPNPGRGLLWLLYFGAWGNTDWGQVFLKDWGPSQQHNLGLNGGNEKISYYFGLGYNHKGAMDKWVNDGQKRYNLRANFTSHLNKWITLAFRSSFSQEDAKLPNQSIGNFGLGLYTKMPTSPLRVPGGGLSRDAMNLTDSGGVRKFGNNDSWITGEVTLNPLPGWEIKGNYSYNYYQHKSSTSSFYPQYIQTDGTRYPYRPDMSSFYSSTTLAHYHNYNIYTTYEKNLDHHYFKLLVGYQQELRHDENLNARNTYLYSSSIEPTLGLTYNPTPTVGDSYSNWATEGTFIRFNYNYRDKYLLEFNGRYDGASLFPSNRRYHFFPSVSAGYNIARESFWKPWSHMVGNLKLRASYGALGDVTSLLDAGNYYLYQTTLTTRTPSQNNYLFGGGQEAFVMVSSLKSPNVTWAKPSMLDFGIDIGALNERLQFTFDWYRRRTTDLYGPPQQFPGVLGVAPPQENNASIETKGFDLTAAWDDHIGKLHYNARFILSNYKGKVLSYPNPVGSNTTWYEGENMGDIWGYKTVGLYQSEDAIAKAPGQSKLAANWHPGDVQYQDLNGDGTIDFGDNTLSNPGDKTVIGNNTPRFSYGFTLSADYNGFDFQAFVQGVAKRKFWPGSTAFFWGINGSEWGSMVLTTNVNNRWTPETPNGYFPRYYMSGEVNKNYQTQTRYLLNGAYFRLKNLQIGYTLPQSLTRKIHVERLRVYASAENVWTMANGLNEKFQVDPEALIGDQGVYPIQRTFSFGINLNIR